MRLWCSLNLLSCRLFRSLRKLHMQVYNHHQTLSVPVGLPRLRPSSSRSFASNFRSNFDAFPNSPLSSHVFFQRTLYFFPDIVFLLSSIFRIFHFDSSTCVASPCLWTCLRTGELVTEPLTESREMIALRISSLTLFDSKEVSSI